MRDAAAGGGGALLSGSEFSLFRTLVYQESGLWLADAKRDFLEHRVARRMRERGIASPYWYYRFLLEHREDEMPVLLELLTVNETSFFRNRPQFDLLGALVLPELRAARDRSPRPTLRIWSAGCSTGEEPYSIAITVLETLPAQAGWEVAVYASDLSLRALQAARRGRYAAARVHGGVPEVLRHRYFDPRGDEYEVREAVRRLVVFDVHNLKHDNGLRDLDVIFCRNVMIYFDEGEQRRLVDKFHRALRPRGHLFLGHAESLCGQDERFDFVCERHGAAYRKREETTR